MHTYTGHPETGMYVQTDVLEILPTEGIKAQSPLLTLGSHFPSSVSPSFEEECKITKAHGGRQAA